MSAEGSPWKTLIFTLFAEGAKRHSCILTWFPKHENRDLCVLDAFLDKRKYDTVCFMYVLLTEIHDLCIFTWYQGNPFSTNHVKMQGFQDPILVQQLFFLYPKLAFWEPRALRDPLFGPFWVPKSHFWIPSVCFLVRKRSFGFLGGLLGCIFGPKSTPNDSKWNEMKSRKQMFMSRRTKNCPLVIFWVLKCFPPAFW